MREEEEQRARRERERQARQLMRADRDQCLLLFIIVCSSESQNAVLVSS